MIICPACSHPIYPNTIAVPVIHIDEHGNPITESLDFAHHRCPRTNSFTDAWGIGAQMIAPSVWRLP